MRHPVSYTVADHLTRIGWRNARQVEEERGVTSLPPKTFVGTRLNTHRQVYVRLLIDSLPDDPPVN